MKNKLASPGAASVAIMLVTLGFTSLGLNQVKAQGPLTKVDASFLRNSTSTTNNSLAVTANFHVTNSMVTALGTAVRSGTSVASITITNKGTGYVSPPTVTISGGGGSGANATAYIDTEGHVVSIVINNGGTGYTSNPTVAISAPVPGGVGSSLRINTDISANRTLTLDGNHIVGQMILGDLSSTQVYTIESGTGGSLIFDNAGNGGGAFLNKFQGGADVISAPIVLNDTLNIRVTTNRLTLADTITGSNLLTSYGNGVLSITGNNTNSDFTLWLWNKGAGNSNAQVELGATVGNAVGGNIIIGNASLGTSGHAVLQLLQGRSNLDQIKDTSTVMFNSYSGSGRNNYFKLMGGNETVGRILDLGSLAVIENRESEGVTTAAKLTIAGNEDSYVTGFIRDNSGNNLAQADADGSAGTRGLAIEKQGTGGLTMQGNNIIFTGGLTVSAGTVTLRQTLNFRSDVVNNGTLIFDTGTLGTTGVWNFTKSFADPDGSGSQTAPESQNLFISGNGSVEKTGNGILRLGGSLTESQQIGGSLTVRNGTLQISGRATQIGGALIVQGDVGLNRNVNLLGATTIGGGIDATGRYNNVGSAINIRGTVFTEGDQGASVFQDGVATISGAIKLNYIDLILDSDFSVGKTSGSSTSGSSTVTVTDSSSLVVGMRVSGSGVQSGTVITAINPVTRVVTLSKTASIPGATSLTFNYSSNTDGVINGTPTSLTIVGRPNIIGLASNTGRLVLNNSQYSNNNNRIPNGTPIITKGGVIEFVNDATNNAFSETLGALTLSEGQAQITGYQAGASGSSTLTFASLTRNYGATVEFAGRETSGSAVNTVTNNLGTNARNKILVTGGLTLDDGIIGGWAWANNEFVKYGANGVTILEASDYETGVPSAWSYTKNVKVKATVASNVFAAHRAVNSMNIQPDGTANVSITLGSKILSIESGGLLSNNGNHTITGTGTTGYVTVGTASNKPAELITIVGTNSNTNSTSANALTLNTAIRDFTFTQSTSGVGMAASSTTMTVPSDLYPLLMVGMTVTHQNLPPGTTITAITRTGGGTTITLSNAATNTITSGSGVNAVTFTGGSVGLTKSGPGTLILSSTLQNTYSGPTVINNGILRLRSDTNLGSIPSVFSANHIQLNGGTLQFGRDALSGIQTERSSDQVYTLTDGNRGVSIGDSGGRIEVGHINPNPESTDNNANVPIVDLTITNPIQATGVLELAVRANTSLVKKEYNLLTLGTELSTNSYGGGIKTEGTYNGIITINGNNYVNGVLMEGAEVTFAHNNNFSGTIRILSGQLYLNGSNTYDGSPNFTDTIVIGAATLTLNNENALGSAGFKVNMADNAGLVFNGTNQTLLSMIGTAASTIRNGSEDFDSTLTIDLPINEIFNGRLDNGGSKVLNLVKNGPGRLALTNGDSGFTGNVIINEGVIDVTSINFTGGQSALGKGSTGAASEIVLNGGALSFTPRGQQFTDRSITIGTGTTAATLVANGVNQAARVIIGADFTRSPGNPFFEQRVTSAAVGFVGTGARTLTLSGVNIGDNEFQLQLDDNSPSEPTSLLKIGSGTWALGHAGSYSGETTLQEGVLAIFANNTLGTTTIATTVNQDDNTFTGNMPNGVEVSFTRFIATTLPGGILADTRYYVVNSTDTTFQVATTKGGSPIDLTTTGTNVQFVPNIQSVASTVANSSTGTFTGNLPNGTAVVFGTQIPRRLAVSGTLSAALPGGINANTTYYVVQANGTTFRVAATLGGTAITLTNSGQGDIYYTASLIGNTSSGINVVGGRLELRNVDYITPETITFQGGAFSLPRDTTARWTGNIDVQANTTFTIGVNSEFIFDGNLLGTRAITQLGEGTVRLRGETITPTAASSATSEMENSRRSYTVQAGTLILDYSLNNNSKLIDTATLVLGGGRRGGVLRLQGGSHEEIVNALSLSSGANQIYRDSGTSTIRLNTISRAEGASLYFDLSRIATVDNLNINNILGGWAIIRDALSQATWVLPGTVVRDILTTGVNVESNTLTIKPAAIPLGIHYLGDGAPVRFTSTGTLPTPLLIDTTYYVTNAGANSFKVSATPFGSPIDLIDVGSDGAVHTVSSYASVKRLGPATLTFTANPDNYPGSSGNDIFRIEIANVTTSGAITSTVSGPAQPTPANPRLYKIITTSNVNSAVAIVNFVRTDPKAVGYFVATYSGADTQSDKGNYGPTFISGGTYDNGNQALGWARNGTNTADGLVQANTLYQTDTWSLNGNTDVTQNSILSEISSTYTLRFAAGNATTIELLNNGGTPYTLQTGSILISPTVGANDSSIIGAGQLTTNNEGNLRNFLFHQYNELGDLVIGTSLVERAPIVRSGRLTSGNRRILSGLSRVDDLEVGATVTGSGIPANSVITEILEFAVVINNEATGGDVRNELTFTVSGTQIKRYATQQTTTTQNRINGVYNAETMELSTSDIYLGMPISGPGIPPGALVDFIFNDTDIRINTNHHFNGLFSTFTLTPSVGIEKLGRGTLILSGVNTYTGVTFLAEGTVRAQTLTDGGVAGSLGAATNATDNLNFNGGTLQYVGENSSTNRNFRITDFARINIGHEKTTSIFTGSLSVTGTIGATDRLEKTGSGTLEMRGSGSPNEVRIEEGTLRLQAVDLNAAPATYSQSNLGGGNLGIVRLAGGTLELRGAEEGNTTVTYGGSLYVEEGASEVRAISVEGYNPNDLSSGKIARTTTLNLMGGEETTSVVRSSGGTVRFVEAPEANGSAANIFLNTFTFDRSLVLPWAVYQDTTNLANPGVNNFASVSLTTGAVVSADSLLLYDLGDFFMDANNWGTVEAGSSIDASEGGNVEVDLENGVTATSGSNQLVVSPVLSDDFADLQVGMSAYGSGLPEATKITALDFDNLTITLNNTATISGSNLSYTFIGDRAFFGRVGLARTDLAENASENIAGRDRTVNTLRYYTDADSVITIDEGSTLNLSAGAILVGANVRGGNKSILGEGNITGNAVVGEGTDLIIHNYNPATPFTIGANVVDNILILKNADGSGAGTVLAGQDFLSIPESQYTFMTYVHVGMEVTGPGLEDGTYVTSINTVEFQLTLNKAAISTNLDAVYTFRSNTSFVQTGTGTTVLSGNNVYTGNTYIHGGVLRLDSSTGIPGGITSTAQVSNSSHIIIKDGVLGLNYENFTRSLGTDDNQVEFKGSGGFAAYGEDRTVNFGGLAQPQRLRFGNDGFVADGSSLILGATDATHKVTLLNPIDLGSFSQAVRVENGPADIEGELAGALSGVGKLIKFGQGSLLLSAQNTHEGGIEIAEGRLVAANVPNVFGASSGVVALGTSYTNTDKNAALELTVQGGTVDNDLSVGGVNAHSVDWVSRGPADNSAGNLGSYASMAIVNGYPAIAYYDATEQDLKYVRAADARGNTWLAPVTLASRGDVGQHPSLSVINGNPAVSYYDATNGTLCYIRSTDNSGVFWGNAMIADSNPVSALGLQSDGKVIVGGTFTEFDGVSRTRLARLSSTGVLDTDFNVTVDGEVRAIVIQADNSIIIAGSFSQVKGSGVGQSATTRNNIAMLNSDGSLAGSYNPNANGAINTLLLEPSGNLLVGGAFTNIGGSGRNRVGRLLPAGSADSFNPNANGTVNALARESDGSVLIGGAFTTMSGSTRNRIARVNSSGALQSFNPNANNDVSSLAVMGDGNIYVGGLFSTLLGTNGTATRVRNRLARLDVNGDVDNSFSLVVDAEVTGIKLLSSGKIALLGKFNRLAEASMSYLGLLNADGSLDETFLPAPDYDVNALVEQSNGKLLIGGLFSNVGGGTQHWVGRLNADGTKDVTFNRKVDDRGQYTSMVSVGGFPAIAYYDVANGDLRYIRATNVNGTSWDPSLVLDAAGNVGRGTSMKVANIGGDLITKNYSTLMASVAGTANNGTPAIAYYDQTNGKLKYVLSNTATGSDWGDPVIVQSSAGDVGSYLSMELVNGFPAIAYFNATTGDLIYCRATNVAGVSHNLRDENGILTTKSFGLLTYSAAWGTPQVIDSTGIVGQYPSLTVVNGQPTTASGTPAISYYDVSNGDLKYVRSNNENGIPSVDPLAPVAWGQPVTIQSAGDVGRNTTLVMSDGVPAISYQDVTSGNVKFIHLSDASGYSKLTFTDDTTWNGTINLDGTALIAPDAGQTLTVDGALTGPGGFKLVSQGTLLINSSNNVFGTALGANDPAPAVIRTGNLNLGSSTALGSSRVDLGDGAGNLLSSNSTIISVKRAVIGYSLTRNGGTFDSTHNGVDSPSGGPGAFLGISNTIDGVTYTTADAGTLILVKDEAVFPERNGVYKVAFSTSQTAGTMNLVRADAMDVVGEFVYGIQVKVTEGTAQGEVYYLVSTVTQRNVSPVIFKAQIIRAELATTGDSMIKLAGYFDATHNGLVGSVGGPGAFVEVDTTIDGRTFTSADVGTLILVKDEEEHPEWNGIYRISYAAEQLDGTMNLVRAKDMDELAEFVYGLQVRVRSGTHANEAYWLASKVTDLNASAVLWLKEEADGNLALLANVSGLTIGNQIDVNMRVGAGSMNLGATNSVTTGMVDFTGAITLQDNQTTASEVQNLNLDSSITSGYGVRLSGNITEASASDVLSLTKTGLGVATLTGNNSTFHGGVTVNQGTLLVMNSDTVTGSATGTGLVTVNAGGVLGGLGRIGGSVQLTGTGNAVETRATLYVGDPTTDPQANEKLTIGGTLTVGPNSVVEFTLGVTNTRRLAANSVSITPTGRLLVSLADGFVPTLGTEFDIMDLATINSLTFTAGGQITLSEYLKLPGAYVWDTSKFLTEGKITVTGNTTPVAIVTSPSGATVNPGVGTTVNFTVTVSGSSDFVYQLEKSVASGPFINVGTSVRSSSTTNTFTLSGISESDEAVYRITVTNGEGSFSATSNTATLIVNDPPVIVQQPTSTTLNPGETATFGVTVSGPGPYSFQWRKGSTNITPDSRFVVTFPTAQSCQLAISNVQESDDRADYNVIISNLAGAAPTSSFVALNVNNPVVITNPPASLQVSNQDPASFIVNATGTAPLTYQWQRDSGSGFEDVAGATNQRFTIPSVDLSESGQMVRVKVTNVVGTVTSAAATITVVEGVPSILQQPESYTLLEGNTLSLTVRVGGAQAGRSVVWKRNKGVVKLGANTIKGVTSNISVTEELDGTVLVSTLTIENISTGLAGEFSVDAKNVNVKKPVTSTPGTGQIVVVNNPNVDLAAEDGAKSAAMTVTAVGPKGVTINYLWKRNGEEIPAEETTRILGGNTKTLTIKEVTTADTAIYTCEVTGTGDSPDNLVVGGTYNLKVYTEAPVLGTGWDFPPAMVGEYFEFQVPLGGGAINTPDKYAASGLPSGLKLDAKTGWIRGYPTKVGDFPVVITISNKQGKVFTDPAPVLEVQAVPEGAVGVFAGWIPRDPDLNDDMGGRFDMTTTTKGTFSGKLTLGATAYAFKGILDLDATLTNPPTATVSVVRKGKTPVDLVFTINPAADRLASASVTASVQKTVEGLPVIEDVTLPFTGWRNKWSKLLPANGYIGYHTVALMPPDGLADDLPQGDSYASITVAADGKLKMLGKTADGQTISGSQFVGPLGEIVVYQILYKTTPKGSLLGQLDLSIGDDSILEDNTITGSPTWNCPENLSSKNRLYPNGFGPITLTATGGGYVDPSLLSTPTLILGLQDGTDNATLEFSLDGLSVVNGDPSLPTAMGENYLSIRTGNKISYPTQNAAGTKISVTAKTGLFKGTFKSKEVDLIFGNKGILERSAAFQGIIVKTNDGLRGMGYFVLPKYPEELGETVKTTLMISNQVLLAPR